MLDATAGANRAVFAHRTAGIVSLAADTRPRHPGVDGGWPGVIPPTHTGSWRAMERSNPDPLADFKLV
jgi:hypothetical protein